MTYEALFYDGWADVPAYYLIDGIEGRTAENALANNLDRLIQRAREQLDLSSESVSDLRIRQSIYVLRRDGLVSPRE
ncbi:MAG TPA: hypothetical protein VFA51_00070 [Candidatus Udaeobacter sp.]|jgi:hypothetical protein|nr:hypothetical protein [Candidatus Udaeobacter sp.]